MPLPFITSLKPGCPDFLFNISASAANKCCWPSLEAWSFFCWPFVLCILENVLINHNLLCNLPFTLHLAFLIIFLHATSFCNLSSLSRCLMCYTSRIIALSFLIVLIHISPLSFMQVLRNCMCILWSYIYLIFNPFSSSSVLCCHYRWTILFASLLWD